MAAGLSRTKTGKQDVEVEEHKLCLSETEREGVLLTKDDSAVLPAIKWMAAVYVLPRDRKKSTARAGVNFHMMRRAPCRSAARSNELLKLELSRTGQRLDGEGTSRSREEGCPDRAVCARNSGAQGTGRRSEEYSRV